MQNGILSMELKRKECEIDQITRQLQACKSCLQGTGEALPGAFTHMSLNALWRVHLSKISKLISYKDRLVKEIVHAIISTLCEAHTYIL